MSIVYLSSNGQNPHNFTNQFAQGIQLGRGAEVSVMGYSGNLRNRQVDTGQPPTEMNIVEGINDAFTIYHGELDDNTDLKEAYYAPFLVKLDAGIYDPDNLATEIARAINQYEYIDQYKYCWTCTWSDTTRKMTIGCGKKRQPANGSGNWVAYGGENGGITPAPTQDTLIPFTAVPGTAGIKRPAFLDLKTGFIGDTTQAVGGLAAGSQGYEIRFTTTDTDYSKIQVSMGIVPEKRATRCDRNMTGGLEDTMLTGKSRDANLIWNGNKPINAELDFAMVAPNEYEWVGFFGLGMCVGLDGRVGIIETKVGVESSTPKSSVNRTITWTATNIGAAGNKKLMMCPRFNGGGAYPVMDFLADVGAGFVLLATKIIGGVGSEGNYYSNSVKLHYGVVFDIEYVNAAMVNAWVVKSQHSGLAAGVATDPTEDTTIGWKPFGANNSLVNNVIRETGLLKLQEQSNISDFLGFKEVFNTEFTAFTTPFVSTEAITTNLELERVNQPLIITSHDLTAKGYIGCGAGGMGAEAAILGVVRTNGQEADYGFSTDCKDNWIHLNNTSPIMLNSLNITLKDEYNREGAILEPNFNVWLKFRCNQTSACPPKHNLVVGGTYNY